MDNAVSTEIATGIQYLIRGNWMKITVIDIGKYRTIQAAITCKISKCLV
jgi:hypothetical protein